MLIVTVRDGKQLSLKTNFVTQIIKEISCSNLLFVYRKEQEQFTERKQRNEIELATSPVGIALYFAFLYFLKSPKDLKDGIVRRLHGQKNLPLLIRYGGSLTVLSQALYQYFARSARTDNLLHFLEKQKSPKIFLIDEFFSLNVVNLKALKKLGSIIYVSSDFAYDFYKDNPAASKLMYKFEQAAIALPDLVVVCSERDKLKYLDMGAKEVTYYPNIYPMEDFDVCKKSQTPSISIVLRGYWGPRITQSLEELFQALGYIGESISVNIIGAKPRNVPKNVELHSYDFIPSKQEYLEILSKSWIGINLGVHLGGTNQRKYDYALSGSIVFSDNFGVRGDLLPHEYAFVDKHDLAAKLQQLLELGRDEIAAMGLENRQHALSLVRKQQAKLQNSLDGILKRSS